MSEQIVWQAEFTDYDAFNTSDVFTDPIEAYKAAGLLTAEGEPVRKPDHNWTVYPRRVYATLAEAHAEGQAEADKWKADHDYENPLDALQRQAYIECYYLPAVIQKYIDGKRLDKSERLMLGMEEP